MNWKNSGVNDVNQKNGVNVVEPKKKTNLTALNQRKAVLTAFNRKNSGVNGSELEK